MPAKSEAQRRYLNARFGHAWVMAHHFDNSGRLPERMNPIQNGREVVKKAKKKKPMKGKKKMPMKGKKPKKMMGGY